MWAPAEDVAGEWAREGLVCPGRAHSQVHHAYGVRELASPGRAGPSGLSKEPDVKAWELRKVKAPEGSWLEAWCTLGRRSACNL